MSTPSCCQRCGAPFSSLSSSAATAGLCSACSAPAVSGASAPWWVTAPPLSLPAAPLPPATLPPGGGPTARALTFARRFPGRAAAVAASLVLVIGLLFGLWPQTSPAEPSVEEATEEALAADPAKPGPETSLTQQRPPSAVTLRPASRPPEAPAPLAPDLPPQQPDQHASSRDAASIASTPPPLTPPGAFEPDAPRAPARAGAARVPQRLDVTTEEDLLRLAARAPEIGLGNTAPAILSSYLSHVPANQVVLATPNLTDATPLLEVRPDLLALPMRFGGRCKLNGKLTAHLDRLSRQLRVYLDTLNPAGPDGRRRGTPAKLHQALLEDRAGNKPVWVREEAIPGLVQILMGEEAPFRRVLVDVLGRIEGPVATTALAQRAVFDFNPDVRKAAVAALRKRPAADARPVLLKALRYPWAVPAQHAVETLLDLEDREAVPALVSLLHLPDPSGPLTVGKDRHILQDVVRLNHFNNCLMCHPPAATPNEPVLGVDPVVPLPVMLQTPPMIQGVQQVMSRPGGHGSGGGTVSVASVGSSQVVVQMPLLIRGDITFLRQDFSVLQPVTGRPAPGTPPTQRFDFVIRTRTLSRSQSTRLEAVLAERSSYPQRDAVLVALRGLTGTDAGPTTEAWLQLYPNAETDVKAAELSAALRRARGGERERLLTKYRDSKGLVYTQALACAISSLSGSIKERARVALVERMKRMSAKTLRDKLEDEDAEVRRAALLACAGKKEKQVVPDLIALLDSSEAVTARLAEEGLVTITGEHQKHPAAWKKWWEKQAKQAAPDDSPGS